MSRSGLLPPWRRVLVYGLGLSGVAAARLLRREGIAVLGIDDAEPTGPDLEALVGDDGVELRTGPEPGGLPDAVDAVVLSPGVPPSRPLVREARGRRIPVLGEVELGFPFVAGPILAVTGSNGKSTTTAMTGAIVAAAGRSVEVCGNIGRPLTAAVADPERRSAVFVVELSSFQLETIRHFRPRAAALLNLSPDHLDRYPGLDEYRRAKERIFANQTAGDVAVLPADDPPLLEVEVPGRERRFSRLHAVPDGCWRDETGRVLEARPDRAAVPLFAEALLALPGPHNLENAMAAALLARAIDVSPQEVERGLAGFSGLPHRTERVGELDGVVYWDDSKGTNVGATLKALEGFPDGRVRLILGGRAKGGSFDSLVPAVRRKAAKVYLIGEAAAPIADALGRTAAWVHCGDLERALGRIRTEARRGDAVLLSPACASFDQYRDFHERGEHFQRLVRELQRRANGQEARV